MRIEESIISSLLHNEEFAKKVSPFLQVPYFSDRGEAVLVGEFLSFFAKFNKLPTEEILRVEIGQRVGISEDDVESALKKLTLKPKDTNLDWLVEHTEKFCRDKSLYLAIIKSIGIIDGKDKNLTKDAIPKLLQEALAVSFSTQVGHEYLNEAEDRYEFYTRKEERIEFDIDMLNQITQGGLPRKTLTILLAESGGGKSLVMSHMASSYLKQGLNVLYITLEMADKRIAERTDANLLNVEVDQIKKLSKDAFMTKIDNIGKKTRGKLFIKEYPTGAGHSGHFRGLIDELKTKKGFVPDVIFVDYLGICASARVKMGAGINSYGYLKAIAEELRGLAVEHDVALITAGQLNRGGFSSSDVELTDTADSMAIVHTADLMLALIRTEELDDMNQLMIKQLKNRFADPTKNRRFVVGLNRAKMKLYDLEGIAQANIVQESTSTQSFDVRKKTATDDFSKLNF